MHNTHNTPTNTHTSVASPHIRSHLRGQKGETTLLHSRNSPLLKYACAILLTLGCLAFGETVLAKGPANNSGGLQENAPEQVSVSDVVDGVGLRQSFTSCIEKSEGITVNMLNCTEVEHEFQDKRLNSIYQSLQRNLPAKRRTALTRVQRLWVQYHGANCKAMIDPDGGTAQSIITANCYLMGTARRAQELENWKIEMNLGS